MKKKKKQTSKHKNRTSKDKSNTSRNQVIIKNNEECSYLPKELWTQILTTLPVKTLLKLRCVNKTLCSIIDDPDFIATRFKLSKNNCDTTNLLLSIEANLTRYKFTVRRRETAERISKLFYTKDMNLVASCNGLLLMRRSYHYTRDAPADHQLFLWNPSIRKSLLIQQCPLNLKDAKYVFGYSHSRNDYMIHAFQCESLELEEFSVAVYTLSDNVWSIRNSKIDIPMWVYDPDYHKWSTIYNMGRSKSYLYPEALGTKNSVFLYGALHWLRRRYTNVINSKSFLISFDFETEGFSYLELPNNDENEISYEHLFVVGESLRLFQVSSKSICVWVMERADGIATWKPLFSKDSSEKVYKLFGREAYPTERRFFCIDNVGELFCCEVLL